MHPSRWTFLRARAGLVSVLAVAIAALLTAGAPIAMRKASMLAAENAGPPVPPASAADGIDVVIAPSAGRQIASRVEPAAAEPALPPAEFESGREPFLIDLPEGWTGGELETHDEDADRAFRYADDIGRYFIVNLDPAGSDFDADEVWRYRVAQDRFEVATEDRCVPGQPTCSLGDGQQTIYAIFQDGGSANVGAHSYYFRFGDTSGEIGGTRVFRQILESIRVIS